MAPAGIGIGLRAPHYRGLLETRPPLDLLEVHAENFFGAGGAPLAWLERFRSDYALSIHGVGLSLGSVDPLDEAHLSRLAALVGRFQPAMVSEHLSWSSIDGRHAHDLLPLPFTREAVAHVCDRIDRVQEQLRCRLLVENVSAYVRLGEAEMDESQFLSAVAERSGCALLLDVNNVWVNASNFGFDALACIHSLAPEHVCQYHLGGHEVTPEALIDTHGSRVSEPVWQLFRQALGHIGPRPVIVEWDNALPALEVLLEEARHVRTCLDAREPCAA